MTATINDGLLQTTTVGGETSIDFDFPIYTTADLEVIRTRGGVDTTLVLTTDYTIAASELNDPTGGVITLTSAAVAGDIYTCRSNIQEARSADFQQGGDFFSATVNSELDRIIRITQQLRRDLDRAVQISPASTISPSSLPITMDDPVDGSLLAFSSSGGIEPVTIASLGLSGLDTVITSLAADDGLFWNGTHWVNSKVTPSKISSGAATSGQVLSANGSGGAAFTTISAAGRLIDVQTFTSSGTWTKPAGTTAVEVWVVGGGGGGGYQTGSYGGGGAGGGSYKYITTSLGATETVTIGAGGTGAAYASATNGGTSSFGAHCSATGGNSGGQGGNPYGGSGGSGSGGTINITGNPGAGSAQIGNANGGDAPFGLGTGGKFSNNALHTPSGYGAGGSALTASANNGTSGIVIVKSYS